METEQREFVAYDYIQVPVHPDKSSFLMDSYQSFGWHPDENMRLPHTISKSPEARIVLRFRRNRKIMNKMELTRLQRNFEFCLKEIDKLEHSKNSYATMLAIIIGITGTAFMAGSVFAVTADPPLIALSIMLAVPAFLGWILPYFVFKRTVQKRSLLIDPLIEEKQDEIYSICEKGSRLLQQ